MIKNQITIIMPAYNSEKTIGRAIESVINQTFTDWKLIIVDDNSQDNTSEICKKYMEKYVDKIFYYKNVNKGVSSARNYGISKSVSEFIMFLDSDDTYVENALEKLFSEIKKEKHDWVICGYNRNIISTNVIRRTYLDSTYFQDVDFGKMLELLQNRSLFNQIWNKIYKLDIIKKNNIYFDENISICEDELFNLKYLDKVQSVKVVDDILYDYYSDASGLNFKYIKNRLNTKLKAITVEKQFFEKRKFSLDYIDKLYIYTCLSGVATIVNYKDRSIIKKEINEFIKDADIHFNITKIVENTKKIDLKIIGKSLNIHNYYIIFLIAKVASVLKRIYRKIKFE